MFGSQLVSRVRRFGSYVLCSCLALGLLPADALAQDPVYRVGGDAACDFSSIQSAINAAASHAGAETIRIAQNANFAAQALRITASGDVDLIGGYGTCSSTVSSGRTSISGAGGAADSVIVITGNGNRRLRNLNVLFGDETANGKGGGIDFAGSGVLTLSNVVVNQNVAGFGGGISFDGSGGAATLTLEDGVVVQDNIAVNSGGGIRIEGNATLLMIGDGSTLVGNEALGTVVDSGFGGGLQVLAPATAEIATPGRISFNQGAISGNRAKYGAGVALQSRVSGSRATVSVHNSDETNPTRIDNNIASIAGGGVYMESLDSSGNIVMCASSFRVDHNWAPDGAAFFLDGEFFNNVRLGLGQNVAGCPGISTLSTSCSRSDCNAVDANRAATVDGQATGGAIVKAIPGEIAIGRIAWRDNEAADLILGRAFGNNVPDWLQLHDCLIAGNRLTGQVIFAENSPGNPDVKIRNCTIAGNTLGLSTVMTLLGQSDIQDSIIWQPGKASLGSTHGTLTGQHVIANDVASLAPLIRVVNRDPRFIDPTLGDYHLRASSPAVDFAPAVTAVVNIDLDGRSRDKNLENIDAFGPRDLGAYERQALRPLLLNGNFDNDLRYWTAVGTPSNVSSFDPVARALSIEWTGPGPIVFSQLEPRVQCAHLPLPGGYFVSGLARIDTSNGNADIARLRWEYRRDGGESCTGGTPDLTGEVTVNNAESASYTFGRGEVNVPVDMWTPTSSITIYTTLINGGIGTVIRGTFDGIDLAPNTEQLFDDSFE